MRAAYSYPSIAVGIFTGAEWVTTAARIAEKARVGSMVEAQIAFTVRLDARRDALVARTASTKASYKRPLMTKLDIELTNLRNFTVEFLIDERDHRK
jgi:hypothetical protein